MSHASLKTFPKPCFNFASFGVAFLAVYWVYCILDTIMNSGLTIWQGNSIWSGSIIDPTVSSLGLGTFFLERKAGLRRAILFGIAVFLASFAFFRLWIWLLPPTALMKLDMRIIYPLLVLHEFLVGAIVGTIIGKMQVGWKNCSRFALAGAVGMAAGFVITDLAGRGILLQSPFATGISGLVVGSTWYYLYLIVPPVLQGFALEFCFNITRLLRKK